MGRKAWAESIPGEASHGRALFRLRFDDVRFASLWLTPRVVLGWISLQAGWIWLGDPLAPLRVMPGNESGPGSLLAVGLTLSGIFLMLGALTGPAAFAAGCFSAGLWGGESAGLAALHFALVVLLILTWKSAGWIGLDRWLLPLLGIGRRGNALFRGKASREWP